MNPLRSTRAFPLVIIGLALVLRVALAINGGQYFHFDEARHERGIWIYIGLLQGDSGPLRTVATIPEHTLFPWVGAAVTAAQHLLAQATAQRDWSQPENVRQTIWLGAAVLTLASTLNLVLAHRLARAVGARVEEANAALLLLAASNTAFYYARYLLPYDCAISAGLAGLLLALGRPTRLRALAGGLGVGAAYHLYNGYWYVVPLAWLIVTLAEPPGPASADDASRPAGLTRMTRSVMVALGISAALAAPITLGFALGGRAYLSALREFGGSVTQGLFAEGWSLPWAYLWHSEGGLGVAMMALALGALWQAGRVRLAPPAWVRGSLLTLLGAYALLVLFSVGLERFVVYARTLKPLIVPACLVGGWALASIAGQLPRLAGALCAAVGFGGALHFAPHFAQVYPRDVADAVTRQFGVPKHTLSVAGAIYLPSPRAVTRPNLLLVNAQVLYPVRAALAVPPGQTLLRFSHPLSYPPLQYEGYTPAERTLLRDSDISIRLIQLATPHTVPDELAEKFRYQPGK